MSRGQKRRDHRNFPKMKLRGRRYRERMTFTESVLDIQRRATLSFLRMARAIAGMGKSAAETADVLVKFGQAGAAPRWQTPERLTLLSRIGIDVTDPNATITRSSSETPPHLG